MVYAQKTLDENSFSRTGTDRPVCGPGDVNETAYQRHIKRDDMQKKYENQIVAYSKGKIIIKASSEDELLRKAASRKNLEGRIYVVQFGAQSGNTFTLDDLKSMQFQSGNE